MNAMLSLISTRRFAIPSLTLSAAIAGGACYNLGDGLCDSYQTFGSITCMYDNGEESYVCLTHPYQIIWPASKHTCVTATATGKTSCDGQGIQVASLLKTYSCRDCAVIFTSVENIQCGSAVLTGDPCEP